MQGSGFQRLLVRIRWWGSSAAVAAFAFYIAYHAVGVHAVYTDALSKRKDAERAMQALKSRHDALTHKVDQLATPRGVEDVVRAKFELAKPGEVEYVLVDPAVSTPAPTNTPAPSAKEKIKSLLRI